MQNQNINLIQGLFESRLATLEHLLKSAQTHFCGDESFLQKRIAADMFPFGTQIAFTCNRYCIMEYEVSVFGYAVS